MFVTLPKPPERGIEDTSRMTPSPCVPPHSNSIMQIVSIDHRWVEAMIAARGIEGVRVLQGLLSLTNKRPSESIEEACEVALTYGAWRLRMILMRCDCGWKIQ